MRKIGSGIVILVLLCLAQNGYANVLAAHLNTEPGNGGMHDFDVDPMMDITYRLNEAATSVTIEIFLASAPGTVVATLTGGTAQGLNTVQWDGQKDGGGEADNGTYKFRVIASHSTGHASWDQISSDANNENMFYLPKGVICNRDQTSQYFGTIYVSESVGGLTAAGRTTTEGIFALTCDCEDAIGQGDSGRQGSIAWGASNSPMNVVLDDAGNVVIGDWSDAHSGVWRSAGDLSTNPFDEILDNTGRAVSGLCGNHGSIAGLWATGSGSSFQLYTIDEDYSADADTDRGDVTRYDVGTSTSYTGVPTIVWNDSADGNVDVVNYLNAIRPLGTDWFICQYRFTADPVTDPAFVKFDSGWNYVWQYPATGSYLNCYGNMAVDPASNRLLIGRRTGSGVDVFENVDQGTAPSAAAANLPIGGFTQGTGFDAAGNALATSSTSEILRVWSPPAGANTFTTTYYGTFDVSGLDVGSWALY